MLPKHLPLTREEIALALAAAGYASQEEAAEALDVRQGTLSRWLSGHLVPGPDGIAKIQKLKPRPGRHKEWADYMAEARVRADAFAASIKSGEVVLAPKLAGEPEPGERSGEAIPGPQTAVGQPNSDELANKVVGALPKPRELARMVSMRVAAVVRRLATGMAVQMATMQQALGQVTALLGVLKDELGQLAALAGHLRNKLGQKLARMVSMRVAAVVRGIAAGMAVQMATMQQALGQVTVLLGILKNEMGQLATLTGHLLNRLDAVAAALKNSLDALRATADAVRNGGQEIKARVQQLQAQADELGSGVQQLQAQAQAHEGQSGRRHRTEMGTMVVGFTAVATVMVACTAYLAGRPILGVGLTRGGGVAEGAAKGSPWDPYGTLVHAITGEMGEHKSGRSMPHHPLPHQAVAPCQGSADTLYGACWVATDKSAPCPPDQWQEGAKCYIPIAADPNVPVGKPEPGQGEPTGEQRRPMQEMPGKGEN